MSDDLRNRVARATPSKFTKKPVTIEAIQWTGANAPEILIWITGRPARQDRSSLFIETLEGTHEAGLGDWIIKGVKGEFYPCKPDIFEATYADAALAEIGAARVKPLHWRHVTSTGGRNVHETTHGPYRYVAWPDGGWKLRGSHVGGIAPKDRTLAGAKAAAQADYEARILAAIEPSPLSVREAARVLLDHLFSNDHRDNPELRKSLETWWRRGFQHDKAMREELRAISEGKDDE